MQVASSDRMLIKKLKRYYRDGKFYCSKRCWRTFIDKSKTEEKNALLEPYNLNQAETLTNLATSYLAEKNMLESGSKDDILKLAQLYECEFSPFPESETK